MKKIEHKGFVIQQVPKMPSLYEIKFDGSGKLADALHGTFTTLALAQNRINLYVEGSLSKKVVKNETDRPS